MLRATLAVLLLLVVVVCAPRRPQSDDPFLNPSESCVLVVVENRNFADVSVYVGQSGRRRLGTVVGFTTVRFDVCNWQNVYARFRIHAVGGAFDLNLRAAHTYLDPSRPLHMIIGPRPAHSYVVGQD